MEIEGIPQQPENTDHFNRGYLTPYILFTENNIHNYHYSSTTSSQYTVHVEYLLLTTHLTWKWEDSQPILFSHFTVPVGCVVPLLCSSSSSFCTLPDIDSTCFRICRQGANKYSTTHTKISTYCGWHTWPVVGPCSARATSKIQSAWRKGVTKYFNTSSTSRYTSNGFNKKHSSLQEINNGTAFYTYTNAFIWQNTQCHTDILVWYSERSMGSTGGQPGTARCYACPPGVPATCATCTHTHCSRTTVTGYHNETK